jgi:lipopolysaccharide transport system ATP-binding protein
MRPAIRIEGLGKRYRLAAGGASPMRYRTLRESLVEAVKAPFRRAARGGEAGADDFWALSDVSFEVQPGEVVGIIGRNGAGKSTLLKVLSRITKPTTGRVEIDGRVGSLLEVGTGFHPELTGRENIYLNGSILGMTRREIDRKFDEIVAFAEVGKFLDTPVKRYSSGMYVRLAFAVAAHLEPEILIVDEVLAVGDAGFQKKCMGKMGEVSQSGRTVLLVSHDLPMVGKLSTRAVWLKDGSVHRTGRPADVIDHYQIHASAEIRHATVIDLANHPNRQRGSIPVLMALRLSNATGQPATAFPVGEGLSIEIECDLSPLIFGPTVSIDLCDITGSPIGQIGTLTHPFNGRLPVAIGTVRCRIESLPVLPGEYLLNVRAGDAEEYRDVVLGAARITVLPADHLGTGRLPFRKFGPALIRGVWSTAGAVTGS